MLVDLGTGYLAEKPIPDAVDFCKRKIGMLKEKIDNMSSIIREKQQGLMQVRQMFQAKVAQEAAKAGVPGGGGAAVPGAVAAV